MGDAPVREALSYLLRDVAAGRFPPADGEVTILPQPRPSRGATTTASKISTGAVRRFIDELMNWQIDISLD